MTDRLAQNTARKEARAGQRIPTSLAYLLVPFIIAA